MKVRKRVLHEILTGGQSEHRENSATLFLAHKLKMFTGPHREGPCGNPGKAPAFLSQRVRPAVSLGARSSAPT